MKSSTTLEPEPTPARQASLRRLLGEWFDQFARDLPWRHRRTPYRVAVSEFMLQQTQVKTVLPYFERWVARFPDFETLARAGEEEILRHWQGLGYYARARNLHKLARAIVARGGPPESAAEWEKLPGVGPYTAAAIATFASGEAIAVVDGNVARVLARLGGITAEFPDKATLIKHCRPMARALLDPARPARHNEAMMELGATVCLPRQPACPVCPVRTLCRGRAGDIPRVARTSRRQHTIERILWFAGGQVLLERHAGTRPRLAGLLEIPERSRLSGATLPAIGQRVVKRRSIGRDDYEENLLIVRAPAPGPTLPDGLTWIPLDQLSAYPLAGPHRRWIDELR